MEWALKSVFVAITDSPVMTKKFQQQMHGVYMSN